MTEEATACGRTNHSPQSKEQSSERLGNTVDSSSPTHKGSINQVTSSVRGSFGALLLRPTAMIRRTSCEVLLCASVYYAAGITAFDGWICRVDVIRVGADLSVRPQNRLRSGEDGRTRRSAPTKGYTYHRYTSSASVVDKARRVTRCRDARSERPLYQKLQHRSFNDNGRPLARY